MTLSLIERFDISRAEIDAVLSETLSGADDGELFLEYLEQESLVFDNGRLKSGNFSTDQGFGLRAVAGEAVGYAHAGDFSQAALKRAAAAVTAVKTGHSGHYAEPPAGTNARRYGDENPIPSPSFEEKVKLLQEIDAYLQAPGRRRAPGLRDARLAVADRRDPARRRTSGEGRAAARPDQRLRRLRQGRPPGNRLVRRRRAPRLRRVPGHRRLAVDRRPGAAPGPRQSRGRAGAGRNLRHRARLGLARRHAARGGRPWARGRLQPQEILRLRRADGTTGRGQGRHRRRRRHGRRAARLADHRRRGHAVGPHRADRGRQARRLHAGPAERPADGHGRHRQRPAPVLRPHPHAADDQHDDDSRAPTRPRRSSPR